MCLGVVVGAGAGVLVHMDYDYSGSRLSYALWAMIGATVLGILSPLSNGRIVWGLVAPRSSRLLGRDQGLRKMTPEDYAIGGGFLTAIGIAMAIFPEVGPFLDHAEGWRLYAGVCGSAPVLCLVGFGVASLRSKLAFPLGLIIFFGGVARWFFDMRAQLGL